MQAKIICKDCQHCRIPKSNILFWVFRHVPHPECVRSGHKDYVTGEVISVFCKDERNDRCGSEGRHFAPIITKETDRRRFKVQLDFPYGVSTIDRRSEDKNRAFRSPAGFNISGRRGRSRCRSNRAGCRRREERRCAT